MSRLSEYVADMKFAMQDHYDKAVTSLLEIKHDSKEEAEAALKEYQHIISSVDKFKDTPETILSIMDSANQGLASKIATIANEQLRKSYKGLLSESLSAATMLLKGALKLFS